METYKVTVDEYSTNWYKEDLLHREDGPAIECVNGDKFWYKEGELDRIDGPAIEYANGPRRLVRRGGGSGRAGG